VPAQLSVTVVMHPNHTVADVVMDFTREQCRRTRDRQQPRSSYQISDQAFHFISPSDHTNTLPGMVFFGKGDIYRVLLQLQSRFL
jgi:hypothetical protein